MNPKPFESWQCASCGRVFNGKEYAEKCCVCQTCGGYAGDGSVICSDCVDKAIEDSRQKRWDKAKKVKWDEYDGDCVYIEGLCSEYFFGFHPDEVIDAWESCNMEPFPGFAAFRVWGTYTEPIEFSPDELIELLNDKAYEDYEVTPDMCDELVRLCKTWSAKYPDKTYWPDETIAIVYDETEVGE